MSEANAVELESRPGWPRLLWGILAAPRRTFAYLRESGGRSWLLMAAVLVVLSVVPAVVSGPVSARQARETMIRQLEAQPAFPGAAEIDVEQATAFATSPLTTTVLPAVGVVVGRIFGWLVWAGSLYLLSSMTGGRGTFSQVWQVVVWASAPYGLRSLLQSIYVGATGTLITTPGLSGFVTMPQAEGELVFTPPGLDQLVMRDVLAQLEVYHFWYLALVAIGLMVMVQVSRRKAIGLVLIVWSGLLLLRLLATLLTGSIASGFVS